MQFKDQPSSLARYEPMDCEPNSKFVDDEGDGAKWDCECDPDGKKAYCLGQ